MAITY